MRAELTAIGLGMMLILIGFALIAVGGILTVVSSIPQEPSPPSTSFGAIVFIGPFPIIVGSGPQAPTTIIVGLIILIMVLLAFMMWQRRFI